VTHLGQRLSALIDGELYGSERERVVLHMAKCGSCQDEVASLRMLKRRMNSLGEAAATAGLTGRLMQLSESAMAGHGPMAEADWPPSQPADGWGMSHGAGRPDNRPARFLLAGSIAVLLAGLGTAAFIAGGDAQAQAPALPVTPSVDVLVVPHKVIGDDARPADSEMDRVLPDTGVVFARRSYASAHRP